MKNNTFDIPTYQFYVVRHKIPFSIRGISSYEEAIQQGKCTLIPYEEVDGLTFGDLRDIGLKNEVFIGCFCDFKTLDKRCYRAPVFYVKQENYNGLDNKLIDELVTETLEKKYDSASDYEKRIYKCFFERYQDLSHGHTVDRISKIKFK